MRRRKKSPTTYLTSGKFQHILEQKYGLKIDKDTLVHALASPSDAEQVVLERIAQHKPKLILQAKPQARTQGRHSYLHKQKLHRERRVGS
jgi:hypothetical protein